MASNVTTELVGVRTQVDILPDFCLLQQQGLASRLWEEMSRAWEELSSDPLGFVRNLFTSDTKDARQRRLLYMGVALALVAHATVAAVVVIASWHRAAITSEPEDRPVWVQLTELPPGRKPDPPRGEGSKSGGGQENPLPVTKGLPRFAPVPPLVAINAPPNDSPSLPVNPTIPGELSDPPPPDTPAGDLNAKPSDASSGGPGKRGGLGSGNGPGVGNENGPGGPGGGRDRNDQGLGTGGPDGADNPSAADWTAVRSKPEFLMFRWIYRPTPIVTPEAQRIGVWGTVLVRATFNADGTITDVDVVQPVEFMTESAIESLTHSKFRPATMFGKPITLRRVPVKIEVHN